MGKEKNGQSFCKKDKHAPRRPISAFFFYNQERREKLKKEKPELDNKEIIKTMCAEWNALSDEKKKPYLIKANDDKKRYDAEKRAYDEKKKEYRDLIYNDVNNYLKCERRINKTINDKSTKIEQLFLVDNDWIEEWKEISFYEEIKEQYNLKQNANEQDIKNLIFEELTKEPFNYDELDDIENYILKDKNQLPNLIIYQKKSYIIVDKQFLIEFYDDTEIDFSQFNPINIYII